MNGKEEYQQFLRYVKSTWGALLDNDWEHKPIIKDIVISLFKGEFTVCVSLEQNQYYTIENGKVVLKEYDSNYIKTTYYINEETLLYMLSKGNIIHDLGLDNVKIFINEVFIDHLPINEDLSKSLERQEESYAETMYCIAHDL